MYPPPFPLVPPLHIHVTSKVNAKQLRQILGEFCLFNFELTFSCILKTEFVPIFNRLNLKVNILNKNDW